MDRERLEALRAETAAVIREAGSFMRGASLSRIRTKEGHANFVTDMDVKVQERLIRDLNRILPEADVVAEEADAHRTRDLRWIIDPIDGTTNFICECRFSCISVGLAEGERCILGIVYNPYADELFEAAEGQGAFLNGERIRVSEREPQASLVAMGTSPYHTELADRTFAVARRVFETYADIRRSGSAALDICYVACGRLDGYYELILQPWDYAAGSCILQEAGGYITGIDEPFSLIHPTGILATGPRLRESLYRILKEA